MTPGELAAVHDFVGAMNRRQTRKLMDLFSEDATLDAGPRFDRPFSGRAAIQGMFESYWSAMPELNMILRETYVSKGEAVAIVNIVALLSAHAPAGVAASEWRGGKRLGWVGAFRFTFARDGQIRAIQIYGDDSSARWLPETGVRPGGANAAESPPTPVP